MKKLLILFLFLPIFIAAGATTPWDGTTIATSYAGGDGTQFNPYQISSPEELAFLGQNVNAGTTYFGMFFILTNDLDLNKKPWTPIGTSDNISFQGQFDGNAHLISNLYINLPNITGVGLFGYIRTATIKNLGIVGLSSVTGAGSVGGIIGRCYVTGDGSVLSGCFSNASVTSTGDCAGGVVGIFRTTRSFSINNCYSTGSIKGRNLVAGIVGKSESNLPISNSYATGSLTTTGTGALKGGIVTANTTVVFTLTNCYYINGDAANANGATAKTAADMQAPGFVTTLNGSQSPLPWIADLTGSNSMNNGFPIFSWRINTVPDAPASVIAVAGNTKVSVFFTPPFNDGGLDILDYTVTPYIGTTAGTPVISAGSPVVFNNLVNGTTYTFKVTARNLLGIGTGTTSNAVTPIVITYPLTNHPRLFFLAADEAILKAKLAATPILNKVHAKIISECDKILTLPVQQRVLVLFRMLDVSTEALRRIGYLSYAYRMTGNVTYADRAIVEMKAMAAFSDWNPQHFLDVGEMTMAMAIGYDWLYNYMDATTRNTIANAIKSMGIEQTTGANANQSWMTSDSNWNQVCNGGISAGAAAVYDSNPAYYQPLIDRAISSIKIPMGLYSNNGATAEGYGYWTYGTNYNVMFLDILQQMWNTDSGLSAMPGFMSTGKYITQLEGNATKQFATGTKSNTPQCFDFGDSGSGVGPLVALYWIAGHSSNSNILYNEFNKLNLMIANNSSLTSNRWLPFMLIWSRYQTLTNLTAPTETTYVAQGNSALAVLRTGWGANDNYFAIKGGTPSSSHAHMDIGSFVLDALDVRWAMDFGLSNYTDLQGNGVDLFNMAQTSPRWDVFRLNNMAHNTLTINGNKQLVAGNATVDNFTNTTNRKSVEINLTPFYANDVNYCKRTGALVLNRYVEIKDSIKAGSKALTVRWNLLTQAIPLKVSNKIIRLTQLGKSLYLVFDGTDNVLAKTWSTTPPTTYEEQNSDCFFTGFEYTVPAGGIQTITVKLVPEGDSILNGLVLTSNGSPLNEDFEGFTLGTKSKSFVNWEVIPADSGTLRPVLGEVVINPFKSGINISNQVFKLTRQTDSIGVTPTSYNVAYRGTLAYGYDLRLNAGMVLEFKYYKTSTGPVGITLNDGNGHTITKSYTDPNESTVGYSTSQWRKAQFTLTASDLTSFSATGSASLLIQPNPNNTYTDQVNGIVMYVDDVKLSPLLSTIEDVPTMSEKLTAYYDSKTKQVFVQHLPQNCQKVLMYNLLGSKVQEVQVMDSVATLEVGKFSGSVLIVQAICSDGKRMSTKVICH